MNFRLNLEVLLSRVEVVYPDTLPDRIPAIGLVITTFNRPYYVRKSFESLKESQLDDILVAVVDDASTEPETKGMVEALVLPGVPVVKIFKRRRKGFTAHESVRMGWDILVSRYGCRFLCSLDSDTLVKPDWLIRLKSLFCRERLVRGPLIVTGFNAHTHPVLAEENDFYVKKVVGGINMFFDREIYRHVIRPNLKYERKTKIGWDWHVIHEMQRRGYPFLCTKPSVVQHIGRLGEYSTDAGGYDIALDF